MKLKGPMYKKKFKYTCIISYFKFYNTYELTDELHHLTERYWVWAVGSVADVDLHFSRLPTYLAEIVDRTDLARGLR